MDWIDLAEDRNRWGTRFSKHGNKVWLPYNIGKFLNSCATGSFLRRVQLHGVI
jgi:hypothetical protein